MDAKDKGFVIDGFKGLGRLDNLVSQGGDELLVGGVERRLLDDDLDLVLAELLWAFSFCVRGMMINHKMDEGHKKMEMLTKFIEDDGKGGKLHMSLLLGDPASVVRIKRANAKTNGRADGILRGARVFDFGPEQANQSLEDAALTTLLVVSESVKVLAGNGFLGGGGSGGFGLHGRLREDGLSIRRIGTTALALTRGNRHPVVLGLGRGDIGHELCELGVIHGGC